MNRFKEHYEKVIRPDLLLFCSQSEQASNIMELPRLNFIKINIGLGSKGIGSAQSAQMVLELITGQKAVPTRAKKSIATFKLKRNMIIGATVTLRGSKMYSFLERLVTLVLPARKASGSQRDPQLASRAGVGKAGNRTTTAGFASSELFLELGSLREPASSFVLPSGAQGGTFGMDITFVAGPEGTPATKLLLSALLLGPEGAKRL